MDVIWKGIRICPQGIMALHWTYWVWKPPLLLVNPNPLSLSWTSALYSVLHSCTGPFNVMKLFILILLHAVSFSHCELETAESQSTPHCLAGHIQHYLVCSSLASLYQPLFCPFSFIVFQLFKSWRLSISCGDYPGQSSCKCIVKHFILCVLKTDVKPRASFFFLIKQNVFIEHRT